MTRKPILIALGWLCVGGAIAAPDDTESTRQGAASPPSLEITDGAALYTLGQLISRTLSGFALDERELALVVNGLEDGARSTPPRADLATHADRLSTMQTDRQAQSIGRERQRGEAFRDRFAAKPDIVRHSSGLLMQALTAGAGGTPRVEDEVSVHYEGALIDGTVFDSSRERGTASTLPLRGVIACWTEALQAMKVGGRSRIVCPPELAYGERGAPPIIKPGATLVFDIELLAIVH